MAANIFLQISDIPGDATETNHVDWIVLNSVQFGMSRPVNMADLGSLQRGHANANFQEIIVTTELGKAATKLMASVANGTVRPEITLEQCRAGDAADEGLAAYLIWKIKDSMITSYSVSGSEHGVPMESWTIAYRKIEVEYKATDPTTNALSTAGTFKWNLETGKFA